MARRTNVAAPPVSGSAEVASAYERATSRNRRPTPRSTNGREPDGVQGDDPEREVDRRGDLAVGRREERARVELAAQARQLAGHYGPCLPGEVEAPGAEPDEQDPDEDPDLTAPDRQRAHDERDPEPDHDDARAPASSSAWTLTPTSAEEMSGADRPVPISGARHR